MYAYIRYFGVAGIASLLVLNSNEGNRLGFSRGICLGWIIWEAFLTQSLLTCVELVLLVRGKLTYFLSSCALNECLSSVYVLYDRNRIVLWFLSVLFVIETAGLIAVAAYAVPSSRFNLEIGCVVTSAVPTLSLIGWYALSLSNSLPRADPPLV